MKNSKKTLRMIIVGLVIAIMAGFSIGLLKVNYELSAELENQKEAYEILEHNYSITEDEEDEILAEYAQLVEGIHNMKQHNEYEFSYYYKGKTYHYEGNNGLFGEQKCSITY